MMRNPTTRFISYTLKVAIVFFALFYIARKLVMHSGQDDLIQYFSDAFSSNFGLWVMVLLLAVVNWSIEGIRWRFLISRLEPVSWKKAMRAVLAGVTLGVATPNRIGEFGGRIFFLDKADRVKASLLAFAGSFAQFMVTALAGFWGFMHRRQNFLQVLFDGSLMMNVLIAVMVVMILIFIALIYFEAVRILLLRMNMLKGLRERLDVFSTMRTRDHFILVGWSMLRYFVYSLQFYLVLYAFGIRLGIADGFAAIAVTYFIITVVPTFAFTEVIVRGSAASLVIGTMVSLEEKALAASVALWGINIALPALIGTAPVFALRFFRKKDGHD